MFKKNTKNISIFIIIILFAAQPAGASFDEFYDEMMAELEKNSSSSEIIVESHTRSTSNTGGNYAESGEVVEGRASSSLEVKTIINGKTIQDEKTNYESDSSNAEVYYKSDLKVEEGKASLNIEKNVNGQIQKESSDFILDTESESELSGEIYNLDKKYSDENKEEKGEASAEKKEPGDKNKQQESGDDDKDEAGEDKDNNLIVVFWRAVWEFLNSNVEKLSSLF